MCTSRVARLQCDSAWLLSTDMDILNAWCREWGPGRSGNIEQESSECHEVVDIYLRVQIPYPSEA